MPSESELRSLLASDEVPNRLDAASIIRKSKARRLPAQVAAGGAFTLAVAAIGFAGFTGAFNPAAEPSATTLESATDEQSGLAEESAPQDDGSARTADGLNPCGSPVAEAIADPSGAEIVLEFPAAASATSIEVVGTATLLNSGTDRLVGTTAAVPVITVAEDGVVVWHTNGLMTMQAVIVDLAPGESLEYPASFTPVRCAPEDELAGSFRADLPQLEPGSYSISAAIDFVPDSEFDADTSGLIAGPATTVTLD